MASLVGEVASSIVLVSPVRRRHRHQAPVGGAHQLPTGTVNRPKAH
jgi:hypothetical protein